MLENELNDLKMRVSEEIEQLKLQLGNFSNRTPDDSDQASNIEQIISLQNQLKVKQRQFVSFSKAILKVESGEFGFCEDCGCDIPEARLRSIPDAPCCVDCQEIREHKRQAA